MNLKPALLQTMSDLGITEAELETLKDRLMFSVTGLQAQLNALEAQITTLSAQRDMVNQELSAALVTVSKLVSQP